MNRKLPIETHPHIVQRYIAGETSVDIAPSVGLAPNSIIRILRKNGVEIRNHSSPKPTVKVCTKCGKPKHLDEFYKSKESRDGRESRCSNCSREKRKKYYTNNRDQELQRCHVYIANNLERRRANSRKWQANNPEKHRLNAIAGTHRRRARKRINGGKFTTAQWRAVLAHYNHECVACGRDHDIQADHVIPLACGGSNDITNLQPLCKWCNNLKGVGEGDYRPDKGEFARSLLTRTGFPSGLESGPRRRSEQTN